MIDSDDSEFDDNYDDDDDNCFHRCDSCLAGGGCGN